MSWQVPPWRLMNAAERRSYWWGHWRLGVPAATTLMLLFLMTAPVLVPAPVFPQLGIMAIFVWSMFQPAMMPPWGAFLLGLMADLLFSQPLGVNATLFAGTAVFVRVFEARYGHHAHGFDWGVASVVIIGFELLTWQLMALAGKPVPLLPLGWQALTSIAAYPAVVWLCGRVQRSAFGRAGAP
jgi:rod shape-determining protein MreD